MKTKQNNDKRKEKEEEKAGVEGVNEIRMKLIKKINNKISKRRHEGKIK